MCRDNDASNPPVSLTAEIKARLHAAYDSLPGIFFLYSYPELRLQRWNKLSGKNLFMLRTVEEVICHSAEAKFLLPR